MSDVLYKQLIDHSKRKHIQAVPTDVVSVCDDIIQINTNSSYFELKLKSNRTGIWGRSYASVFHQWKYTVLLFFLENVIQVLSYFTTILEKKIQRMWDKTQNASIHINK